MERNIQRDLIASSEDPILAQQIVNELLGEGFSVDYFSFPKNIGAMGDEGVRGHTLIVRGQVLNPSQYLHENSGLLALLSTRLCNETGAASKVLFDITPNNTFDLQKPSIL